MKAHVRIVKPQATRGGFHRVWDDRIIAVGEDGAEVDISSCVTAWHEHSKVGEPRRIEVVLLGFHVQQEDDSVLLKPDVEAS